MHRKQIWKIVTVTFFLNKSICQYELKLFLLAGYTVVYFFLKGSILSYLQTTFTYFLIQIY